MSRYADAHKNPKGPGDARPTALQIVQDEDALGKLQGKVIIVTGGSSGIGIGKLTPLLVFPCAEDTLRQGLILRELSHLTCLKILFPDFRPHFFEMTATLSIYCRNSEGAA